MLLITTIDMFPGLGDADLKFLQSMKATDKMVVLSKEGATMPVNLFMTLKTLKCSFEIIEIDIKDNFALGYKIGCLSSSVKAGEKVIILSSKSYDFDEKNVVWLSSLSDKQPAPKPAAKKPAAKTERKPAAKTEGKPAAKAEVKPAAKTEGKSAAKTEGKSAAKTDGKSAAKVGNKPASAGGKKGSKALTDLLAAYPELKKYKKLIAENAEAISEAIVGSSDAEIGLPFQLQLRGFGGEKDDIAGAIKADFAKIKKALM